MLIKARMVGSDGTLMTETFHDLEVFIQDNTAEMIKSDAAMTRLAIIDTLRRGKPFRLNIMGGMYCDVIRATLADTKAHCRSLGWSLSHKSQWGEYRAAPYAGTPQQREDRAIYDDDLASIVGSVEGEQHRIDAMAARALAILNTTPTNGRPH